MDHARAGVAAYGVLWVACLLPAQGCSKEPGRSATLDLASAPAVTVTETATIGGSEAVGPDAFGSVSAVSFLDDGAGVAVADGQTEEIHVFTLSGRHVATTGGKGGGPGEFRSVRAIQALRDGRWSVWDVQGARVTVFAEDREVLHAGRADLDPVRAMIPAFVGFLSDGRFVLRDRRDAMGMKDEPEGMIRDTLRLFLYSAEGAFLDTLAVLQDQPKWFRNRDRTWGRQDLIFGPQLTTLVVGDEVWVGSTRHVRFTRYLTDGDTAASVALDLPARPASEQDVEDERSRLMDSVADRGKARRIPAGSPDGMDEALARISEAELASEREVAAVDTIPDYDRVVPVRGGSAIWLRWYPGPRDSVATWMRLTSNGRLTGVLTLPREREIKAADEGYVATLERDLLDAPVIRVLRIRPASGT